MTATGFSPLFVQRKITFADRAVHRNFLTAADFDEFAGEHFLRVHGDDACRANYARLATRFIHGR